MTDAFLDATAQAELVRSGAASALELVDAAIARVEQLNPTLNAVIHPLFDKARARAAQPIAPDAPFAGVPILFKDLDCAVAGDPHHAGMRLLKDAGFTSPYTDHIAQRYFDAGFICIGRTNTPEHGLVPTTEPYAYGATRNPWDTSRSPGGSSGGSAASVAAGIVPVAHANDGGGSIRIPASACGLVGLKPSRGRVSSAPHADPIISPLTVDLCVSRSVRDTAAILDALSGPATGDTSFAPPPDRPFLAEVGAAPGRLRIGILTENPLATGEVDPVCVAATEQAGKLLESLGHEVEPAWPSALASPELVAQFTVLWAAGLTGLITVAELSVGRAATEQDMEPLTWQLHQLGRTYSALDYQAAVAAAVAYGRAVASWWDDYDLLLTPTLASPPVPLGTFDTPDEPLIGFLKAAEYVPFTAGINVTGQPAISLPTAWHDGLPIGTQLIAAYGREDLLLRVAAQVEQAQPWAGRIPPVHAG